VLSGVSVRNLGAIHNNPNLPGNEQVDIIIGSVLDDKDIAFRGFYQRTHSRQCFRDSNFTAGKFLASKRGDQLRTIGAFKSLFHIQSQSGLKLTEKFFGNFRRLKSQSNWIFLSLRRI
jgi:hypothetical protein